MRTQLLGWVLSLALGSALVPLAAAADISGKWQLVWDTEGGIRHTEWTISQEGKNLTVDSDGQVLKGTLEGARIVLEGQFYAAEAGYASTLKVEATLTDDELKGKGTWGQYSMTMTGKRAQ